MDLETLDLEGQASLPNWDVKSSTNKKKRPKIEDRASETTFESYGHARLVCA